MHLKTNRPVRLHLGRILFYIFLSLLIAGCAEKPWTDPLLDDAAEYTSVIIDQLAERDKKCEKTLDADLEIHFKGLLGEHALNGHLQLSVPSAFRFTVVNPFGQPVFMVAGDQKNFQSVNTLRKKFLSGRLRSFFLLNDIPTFLLSEHLGDWLTSRNSLHSSNISEIRQDREQRGVWITFQHSSDGPIEKTHVLLAPDETTFLTRVIEDSSGKILATTYYSNWSTTGRCKQPLTIDITGLDYGSDINLKFTNIQFLEEKKTYSIPPPPGFNRQYLP